MTSLAGGEPRSQAGPALDELPTFSPKLEHALAQVYKSDDPMDAANFNPIDFINQKFADEQSLSGLDAYSSQLSRRLYTLAEAISKDVREYSGQKSRTKRSIESANTAIVELFAKIKAIKAKAIQSELMVQEICRDIKSLDYAKKHLTATILALRNLHMLVSAVEQLDSMADSKHYRDAAQMLKAIGDLLSLFQAYKDVPKMQSLQAKVDVTKDVLKTSIFKEFHSLLGGVGAPDLSQAGTRERLHNACLVLDVLEPLTKHELVQWFVKIQLDAYTSVFGIGREGATLSQVERRYAWIRKELETYDVKYAPIFPPRWEIPALICKDFCTLTRSHLVDILASTKSVDINALIRALKSTLEAEHDLTVRFNQRGAVGAAAPGGGGGAHSGVSPRDDSDDEGRVEAIKNKHAKKKEPEREKSTLSFVFEKSISDCFSGYLGVYVEGERNNLKELLQRVAQEEKWTEVEEAHSDEAPRLAGSDEVFLYVKKSIKRCKRLTTGEIFFKLFEEYKVALTNYRDLLSAHIPKAGQVVGGAPGETEFTPFTPSELNSVCLIVNTAEYCNETLPSLAESIKKIIDEEFQKSITLDTNNEEFSVVINQGIAALVGSVLAKASKVLGTMSRLPWSTWTEVGDQSEWVNDINRILKEEIPPVRNLLSPTHYNFFCTQLVSGFIPRFVQTIYRIKRIGEMGAQQLSLDAHSLKTFLLEIPNIAKPAPEEEEEGHRKKGVGGAASRAFSKYVTREMGKAESVLKTLVSPPERLIGTFKALLPQSDLTELTRIMQLRGLRRAEQQQLLDAYNAQVAVDDRIGSLPLLETESAFQKLLLKLPQGQKK